MISEKDSKTVLTLLSPGILPNHRKQAIDYFCLAIEDEDLCKQIFRKFKLYLPYFIMLTYDADEYIIQKSLNILINASAKEEGPACLLKLTRHEFTDVPLDLCVPEFNVPSVIWTQIFDKDNQFADSASMVMVNLTQRETHMKQVMNISAFEVDDILERITSCILSKQYNPRINYGYLPNIVLNLSILPDVRLLMMDPSRMLLPSIVGMLHSKNTNERYSCWGIVKNLSFSHANHKILLEEHRLLGKLLYLLISNKQYLEEEMETFPDEVQYMLPDKIIEPEVEIRKIVLDVLYQLSATGYGREYMRYRNTYIILRDYHLWETNEECLTNCEFIVNLLIQTEEEIGVDNLHEAIIPELYGTKFSQEESVSYRLHV